MNDTKNFQKINNMKSEYYRMFRSFAMSALVLLALLTIITVNVQGQVRFGIKGGMNMSNLGKFTTQEWEDFYGEHSVEITEMPNRFAFHAGVFAEIPVCSFFQCSLSCLFRPKERTVHFRWLIFVLRRVDMLPLLK